MSIEALMEGRSRARPGRRPTMARSGFLILLVTLLAALPPGLGPARAQDEAPAGDDLVEAAEVQDDNETGPGAMTAEGTPAASPVEDPLAAVEAAEGGVKTELETFEPTERISEDRSVAFPNDI